MNNYVRNINKPHIIILGAGFGGLTLASELDHLAEKGKAQVTLVDKNSSFSMGFSMQWAMMDRRNPEDGERSYSNLKPRNIKFIKEEIVAIETEKHTLHTKSIYLNYDYLVIALGAELSMETIPGLSENAYNLCEFNSVMILKEALKSVNEGTIVIMVASTPFKCPPAPYEYAFLIDDILRQRNIRNKIRLVVTTPEPQPMPVAGKAAGDFMKSLLAEKGIEYFPLHKPKTVTDKKIVYENGFELNHEILCVMPVHRAPKVVRESGLTDESGFVPVELGSFKTAVGRVYAVGDVASLKLPAGNPHPKAGVFAEAQAHTVAKNLESEIVGTAKEEYTGSGFCYIDTGKGKAASAFINLLTPEGPKAVLNEPAEEGLKGKEMFESERLQKWFNG
jgi:sulfide:quinone oxidoreductase